MRDYNLIHDLRESGIDWATIAETVEWFTDNDRKVYAGWKLGLDENDTTDLIKLAKKNQAIRIKTKSLGIERSINNEQIRDIALNQTFTQQLLSAIQDRYTGFEMKGYKDNFNSLTSAHIFCLADFHYDGDKSYLEIIKRATREIIRVIKEKDLKEIYLFELGDVIEGASLRNSQLMAIKRGMVDQTLDVADAYIKMLTYLSEFVNVKFYSVDSSNHTQLRNLGTKQNNLIEEDMMKIFNKIIETALPNLDFTHDKEMFVKILGFECFVTHSHEVKGSAIKYIKDVTTHRDNLIDFSFFGHRHHMETIDINSAKSYDKKLLYVPALTTKLSQYELQHNMSSQAGVGYYVLEEEKGLVESRKLMV